jgi:bifunctional non-homologous end joining protein LigD
MARSPASTIQAAPSSIDLLFRRRECLFFAFDLLHLNGEDLRGLPLVERKERLRRLLRRKRSRILYLDHIEKHGQRFFEKVCALDLEGVVAKRKTSLLGGDPR